MFAYFQFYMHLNGNNSEINTIEYLFFVGVLNAYGMERNVRLCHIHIHRENG